MNNTSLAQGAAFDLRSLGELKRMVKVDSLDGLKAAAKQVEGLFVQIMLNSMREATFKDGLFNSQQSEMFTSMYDQQISQNIASQGKMGIANMMIKQLEGHYQTEPKSQVSMLQPLMLSHVPSIFPRATTAMMNSSQSGKTHTVVTTGHRDFISRLLIPALDAARSSGIPHQLIIAQAALESGWGHNEILTKSGKPSYNLFAIKAPSKWKGETTNIMTTEYSGGVKQKVKASFKVYHSYSEALTDYVSLLLSNPRYQSVTRADSPENAAHLLQSGGYATDPGYAEKLIGIIHQVRHSINQVVKVYKHGLSSTF